MTPKNLPDDLNAELLLAYLPEGKWKLQLKGLHKRNAYQDIISLEDIDDDNVLLSLGRNGLYNVLPEFMFHPVDRFDNLPTHNQKEHFEAELARQEKEKENARRFFAPFDTLLFRLRMDVRERMERFTCHNTLIEELLADSLTDNQRQNPFIMLTVPMLPNARFIRGNRTLLTLMLRKVFMQEGLILEDQVCNEHFIDEEPRYYDCVDDNLDELYMGDGFIEPVFTFRVSYWPDECDEHFPQLVEKIEDYAHFVEDWFLAVGQQLCFELQNEQPPLRLSDTTVYNYLSYNTNI